MKLAAAPSFIRRRAPLPHVNRAARWILILCIGFLGGMAFDKVMPDPPEPAPIACLRP